MRKILILLVVACFGNDSKSKFIYSVTNRTDINGKIDIKQGEAEIDYNFKTIKLEGFDFEEYKNIIIRKLQNEGLPIDSAKVNFYNANIVDKKSINDLNKLLESLSLKKINELTIDNDLKKVIFENGYLIYDSNNLIKEFDYQFSINGYDCYEELQYTYGSISFRGKDIHHLKSVKAHLKIGPNVISVNTEWKLK